MSDEFRRNLWQRIRDRVREHPPSHGRGGAAGPVALAVAVALTLALAACGGGGEESDATATPTSSATATLPAVADVAPELADLGDVATVHSQPVTETFGPDGGTMDLADGSRVEVPEGAFSEPTELTAAIVDVDVEDPVKELRVYQLSTEEDVGPLDPPVVLEVLRPADEVAVAELQDGEWRMLAVSPGATTRVNIEHFSSSVLGYWTCVNFIFLAGDDTASANNVADLAELICGSIPDDLSADQQAFINSVVDDTVNELERAGASNENILAAKVRMRSCLTEALLDRKRSTEDALTDCASAAAQFFPTPTPTPTAMAEPVPEPEPEPPPPEPEPPQPVQATLSVLSSSAAFDHCDPVSTTVCYYNIDITLSYVSSSPTSEVSCTGKTRDEVQVSQQSGTVSLTVQRNQTRDLESGELTASTGLVRCALTGLNISTSVDIDVLLPPPS